MKKFFCLVLAIFYMFGTFSENLCCAGYKKSIKYHPRTKISRKYKKKQKYIQKKEIDMFVKYLIAKNDKFKTSKKHF